MKTNFKYYRGRSGIDFAVLQVGVKNGIPIIHFHGAASSRLEVLAFEKFAKKHQLSIIGIDRPGIGKTNEQTNDYSIERFSEDVDFIATQLGFDEFNLQGYSAGGLYAIQISSQLNKRINKCVLINSAIPSNYIKEKKSVVLGTLMNFGRNFPGISKIILSKTIGNDKYLDNESVIKKLESFKFKFCENDLKYLKSKNNFLLPSMIEGLQSDNRAIAEDFIKVTAKVYLDFKKFDKINVNFFHGMKDLVVPFSSEKVFMKNFPVSTITGFNNEGHFSIFNQTDKILNSYLNSKN